jgi:hypothetical protein
MCPPDYGDGYTGPFSDWDGKHADEERQALRIDSREARPVMPKCSKCNVTMVEDFDYSPVCPDCGAKP